METLVYQGGADLFFRDGSNAKRRALRGVPFEVDAVTAEVLLEDPAVARADLSPFSPPIVPTPEQAAKMAAGETVELEEMTKAQLQVVAAEYGATLKARDTVPQIIAAIRAAAGYTSATDAEVEADTVSFGESQGADEDAAPAVPAPTPGSITLEDLPAQSRIQQA